MELKLNGVTKKYGEKTALSDFSYTFTEGIYGILGANGAGKSTLMNLITDNVKRDSGEITYNGEEIRKLGGAFREKLGFMPQQQGLYETMTAESFLAYIARLKKIPGRKIKGELDMVLELTNLSNVRHDKIYSFSGGMKQRVLLAQAMLGWFTVQNVRCLPLYATHQPERVKEALKTADLHFKQEDFSFAKLKY